MIEPLLLSGFESWTQDDFKLLLSIPDPALPLSPEKIIEKRRLGKAFVDLVKTHQPDLLRKLKFREIIMSIRDVITNPKTVVGEQPQEQGLIQELESSRVGEERRQLSTLVQVEPYKSELKGIRQSCENDKWIQSHKIAEGSQGTVYLACHGKDCNYIIKAQKYKNRSEIDDYLEEINNNILASTVNVAPRVFDSWICSNQVYMVTEYLKESFKTKLKVDPRNTRQKYYSQIRDKVNQLHSIGLLHNDLNYGNVMIGNDSNQVYLIDYGLATRLDHPTLQERELALVDQYYGSSPSTVISVDLGNLTENVSDILKQFGTTFDESFFGINDQITGYHDEFFMNLGIDPDVSWKLIAGPFVLVDDPLVSYLTSELESDHQTIKFLIELTVMFEIAKWLEPGLIDKETPINPENLRNAYDTLSESYLWVFNKYVENHNTETEIKEEISITNKILDEFGTPFFEDLIENLKYKLGYPISILSNKLKSSDIVKMIIIHDVFLISEDDSILAAELGIPIGEFHQKFIDIIIRIIDERLKPKQISDELDEIRNKCDNLEWEIKDMINRGRSGTIFIGCYGNKCDYIIKIQKLSEKSLRELSISILAANNQIGPKVFDAWTCHKYLFIVFERIKKTDSKMTHEMYTDLETKLKRFHSLGYVHYDLNPGNILFNENNEPFIIDFGMSHKPKSADKFAEDLERLRNYLPK